MWVYDRAMLRRSASFAFGFSLVIALCFALVHAHPLKAPGGSSGFSTPCEPASRALKASGESEAMLTFDSALAAANPEAPGRATLRYRAEALSHSIPHQALGTYPPLWHRPPPANS